MDLRSGSTACLRDVHGAQVIFAWPVVVEEADDTIVVAQLAGSVGMVPEGYPDDVSRIVEQAEARSWTLVERDWNATNCLHILQPDQWWSARLMWSSDTSEFLCWYVDFRVPVSPNGANLDTRDLQLDVVVVPDGSWWWKDEDHFAWAVRGGFIGDLERRAVESARDGVVAAIEARRFPFDGSYRDWTPVWDPPSLPDDWATV